MSGAAQDMNGALAQLNATIAEFAGNAESMERIAQYARACWAADKKAETSGQLKKYSVDALVNCAYFVQRMAGELESALQWEAAALQQLQVSERQCSARVQRAHRHAGQAALLAMRVPRCYDHSRPQHTQLAAPPLPAQAKRAPLDLRALDSVGTALAPGPAPAQSLLSGWVDYEDHRPANSNSNNNNNSNAHVPPAAHSSSSSAAPPPSAAPRFAAPPPPSFSAPPPPSAPSSFAPPPPQGFAPPPPPPPPDDWDLPPPPAPPQLDDFSSSSSWMPPPPPPPPF